MVELLKLEGKLHPSGWWFGFPEDQSLEPKAAFLLPDVRGL
jgi:hypothetical protein